MTQSRLRVLFMPDYVEWALGTVARSIARFSPWMEATVISHGVAERIFSAHPELLGQFDLAHLLCPYGSRKWLPLLRDRMPCVTGHFHVSEWKLIEHNLQGDAIQTTSEEWRDNLIAHGVPPERAFALGFGLDTQDIFTPASDEKRHQLRARFGIPDDDIVIGFCSKGSSNEQQSDRKGTDTFRQAARKVAAARPNTTFLIVGPGWSDFVDEFRRNGVRCVWIPFIQHWYGLADVYRVMDFYWMTSRVDGGPAPLIESMATEVCLISTPVGLARDCVVDGENAVLVAIGDAEGFARETLRLADDRGRRKALGKSARETIVRDFNPYKVFPRVRDIYASAFSSFAERTGQPLTLDPKTIGVDPKNAPVYAFDAPAPLDGIPRRLAPRIRTLERLSWAEHLVRFEKQRLVGYSQIVRAWAGAPTSVLPARTMLKLLLPRALASTWFALRRSPPGHGTPS